MVRIATSRLSERPGAPVADPPRRRVAADSRDKRAARSRWPLVQGASPHNFGRTAANQKPRRPGSRVSELSCVLIQKFITPNGKFVVVPAEAGTDVTHRYRPSPV